MVSYNDLKKIYAKEDIDDMIKFGILEVVDRKNITSSFKLKLNSIYPASDLIRIRQEIISNQELAKNIENEWSKTNKRLGGNKK